LKGGDFLEDTTKYTYAVSRVRAVEKNMIDTSFLDRLADSKSIENVFSMLEEIDFGNLTENKINSLDFELALEEEIKNLHSFINEITPKVEFIRALFHKNDYHNMKILLKGNSKDDFDDLFIDLGLIPANKLKEMIVDEDLTSLPENLKKSVEMCQKNSSILNDPKSVDIILESMYLKELLSISTKSENKFLINLVMILVDFYNIKSWIRIKGRGKTSWDLLKKVLSDGGKIDKKVYFDYLDKELDDSIEYFKYTDYGELISQSIEAYNESGNFTVLEKMFDNYLVDYLKKAKVITFGVEPVVAYIMAKEIEIKNIRIILTGKINNIKNEIIKERLRDCYV
jgi:V/A-type H+-transporting ATPase subunit C